MDASALAAWDLRAGATVDRYTLHWSGVYPDSASQAPDWSNYDAIYKALVAAGIRPVIMVVRAPIWAVGSGGANPCDPMAQECAPAASFYSAFADFMAQVAQRYPKAAAIEVWNEENAASTWGSWVDPSGYADLLAAAYAAIKRVAPTMPVLMGGLAEHAYNEYANGGQITFMTDSEYLADVYSAWRSRYGGRVYMDGISVHPYPANMSLSSAFGMLDRVRDVRDAFGDGSRPLYATETGISPQLAGISDDQAALTDAELLQALPASDVQGPLLHTLVDVWGSTEDYGMLTTTASGFGPKSSFCAVAAANGSGFICPQPAADPAQQARWSAQRLLHDAYEVARAWWAAHGSFGGFTNAALANADPQLDATTVSAWPLTPGPSADPRQVAIASSGDRLMLCNASQADLSYCIFQTAAVAQGATNAIGAAVTYASGPDSQAAVEQAQALAGLTGGWPR